MAGKTAKAKQAPKAVTEETGSGSGQGGDGFRADGTGLQEMTLEQAFADLEQTIGRLDEDDVSLDESFELYRTGMELLKFCDRAINDVEQKILVINEKGELDEF